MKLTVKRRGLSIWIGSGLFILFLSFIQTTPISAQENEGEQATHIVRYGETLSEIAQAYGVSTASMMDENGIRNANAIYVGQSLLIPVETLPETSTPVHTPEPNATPVTVSVAALNRIYTVQLGDTLPWIALRYGVDLGAFKAINRIDDGSSIHIGQALILPATEDELKVMPVAERYIVQAGDSLGLIAESLDVTMSVLMAVNRISDANLIRPGQELLVPQAVELRSAPQVGPAFSGFYYHSVQPGETLSQIAPLYDTTPQAIVRYNNLPDESTVYSGLEVRIPFGPPVLERRQPRVPHSGTEFVVSISRQRCWVMAGDRIVHEWKCSTGQGKWMTRTGTFHVKTKLEMAKSTAYQLDMPYWLGIYDVGTYENGIHGLPVDWASGEKLWDTLVGQPATFGCAMLLDEDAATLFDLAYIGMPVHVVE